MAIHDMSANFIAQQDGEFEPQRQNNALLEIHNLGVGEDNVTLAIESFPIPKTTLTPIELNHMNQRRKVPAGANVEDMEIVFKDFVDIHVRKVLTDWFLQTYNPATGQIGLAKNYKKRGTITLIAPNGQPNYDRQYSCIGLWISNFDPGDVDHTSEDKMVMNLSLSIDNVIPTKGLWEGQTNKIAAS